jgi:AraC-like DNA-binding protein
MINLHYKLAINDDFPLEDRYEMPIVFHPPGLQAIHRKLRRWHRGWRDGDNMAHLQIVADVHALVASYWTAFGKKLETPAQSDKQIRRVLKEIKLRINTPFNAAELAESVNLSVSQMNRRFRAETGLSPKAHWQQQRAVASRRALRERHETLEQLASVLGFSDVYYFSRWFRQQTGMTASEYRRRSRSLAI